MKRADIKERREALKRRMQESFKGRESRKSSGGRGIFSLKNFDDVIFFSPGKQKYNIDIIPWVISTDGFPTEDKEEILSEGDIAFALVFAVHWGVGPEEKKVLCPKLTFGDPCPICEEINDLRKAGEITDDEYSDVKAKWRVAYNVIDLDEEDDGIQVFETSCWSFHDEGMIDELKQEDKEIQENLCDLEEGYTVSFRGVTKSGGGGKKYIGFKSFSFKKRDHSYDEAIMSDAFPLDAMLHILDYDELKKILHGVASKDEGGEEEDQKGKRGRGSKHICRSEKEETGSKDNDTHRRRRREDDGDGDKDEDDCPSGHKFGTDCDKKDECQDCDKWDECSDKQEEQEQEEKEKKSSKSVRRRRS